MTKQSYHVLNFDGAGDLEKAWLIAKTNNLEVVDVFSPTHIPYYDGIYKKSDPLSLLALVGGIFGLGAGLGVITWISTSAYPTNFGNKPFWAIPSFIPVLFECMILFAALTMFVWFYHWLKKKKSYSNEVKKLVAQDRFVLLLKSDLGRIELDKILHDNPKK